MREGRGREEWEWKGKGRRGKDGGLRIEGRGGEGREDGEGGRVLVGRWGIVVCCREGAYGIINSINDYETP